MPWREGINLAAWWDQPEYRRCGTFQARGYFILSELHQLDAATFNSVTGALYRDQEKKPQDITKVER